MNNVSIHITRRTFKGSFFAFTWEQYKLDNILRTNGFKEFIKLPESFGKYPVIQQGDQPQSGYANGAPFENYDNVVLFGDHTVSLFKPSEPFFLATDGLKILNSDYTTRDFLYYLLIKSKPEQQGYTRHYSMLKEMNISIPNKIEQQIIAALFNKLDNLITLHQRK